MLLGLTFALLALLVLNLAVFDDLRTDASAGVLETFTKPQHLSSLLAVLLAGMLVAFRYRSAARVAVVVAWIEIAAFTFFHGIPVEIGPAKPYGVTGWATRCSGSASFRSLPAARPSSASRVARQGGPHTGHRDPARVMPLRPSALIGLRDALTGAARAAHMRRMALPSWLSTRPISDEPPVATGTRGQAPGEDGDSRTPHAPDRA